MDREIMQYAADQLEAEGYPVILLKYGEKAPAFKAWQERDPLSRFERQTHMRRRPHNIGLDLRNGLLAVDCDGPGMVEWVREHWADSPARVRTARGVHLLFRRQFETRSLIHHLGMPLDIIVRYTVGPPSWIAKTEFRYQWEAFVPADQLPEFQEDWLIREEPKQERKTPVIVTGGCRYGEAALRYETQNVASAVEGTRNATLNRAAFCLGGLIAGGVLTREAVESALTDAALSAGLGDGEIAATLNSGITAGMKRPRTCN